MARHKRETKKLDHDTAVYLAGLMDGEGCLRVGKTKKATSSPYNKVPYTEHELSLYGKIKQLNRVGRPVEIGG